MFFFFFFLFCLLFFLEGVKVRQDWLVKMNLFYKESKSKDFFYGGGGGGGRGGRGGTSK